MARAPVRGQRMQKHWHQLNGTVFAFTVDATALLGSLALDGPFTVLRMLGEYIIGPTSAPVAADRAEISCGIGVVSSDAAAVGATAMPDPRDEADFPWLFWASHELLFPTTTADPSALVSSVRRTFDIKSMRKLKPRESLVFVAQYVDKGGAPPVSIVSAVTRILVAT